MPEHISTDWIFDDWLEHGCHALAVIKFTIGTSRTYDEILTFNHAAGLFIETLVESGLVAPVVGTNPPQYLATTAGTQCVVRLEEKRNLQREARQRFEEQARTLSQQLSSAHVTLLYCYELDGFWTKTKDVEGWAKLKGCMQALHKLHEFGLAESHTRLPDQWQRLTKLGRCVLALLLESHVATYTAQIKEIQAVSCDDRRWAFLPDPEYLDLKRERKRRMLRALR